MKTLQIIVSLALFTLLSCGDDDEPMNNSQDFYGLWEFTNNTSFGDGVFFTDNGFAFPVTYGDLDTRLIERDSDSDNTYSFENNQITYYVFGDEPVTYSGGDRIDYPGGSMERVNGVNDIADFTGTVDIVNAEVQDISLFFDQGNLTQVYNLDGYENELYVPTSNNDGTFYKFDKDLNFIEEVTDLQQRTQSISIIHHNLLSPVLSAMNNDRIRMYGDSNPTAPQPGFSTFNFMNNRFPVHSVTNQHLFDCIVYDRVLEAFSLINLDINHSFDGENQFAFYEASPSSNLNSITGMDYIETQNQLLISDRFNIHLFNVGFNAAQDEVSVFTHEQSWTIMNNWPVNRIGGLYYDEFEQNLFLIMDSNTSTELVKLEFSF